MPVRTSLILDEKSRIAARQLAQHYGCSVSEAVRRSVVKQRDTELGLSAASRRGRIAALRDLFALFEDNDPAEEIRRLKAEDGGF